MDPPWPESLGAAVWDAGGAPGRLDVLEVVELLLPDLPDYGLAEVAAVLGLPAPEPLAAIAAIADGALRRARGRGLSEDLRVLRRVYGGTDWPWLPWLEARVEGPADAAPPRPLTAAPSGPRELPPDFVERFFAPDGLLARRLGPAHEPRPPQLEYARAVEGALAQGRSLVVEGPTGVGKGLGYLVPLVAWGLREGRRVLVSTHTLALQDQLAGQDLPLLAEAAGIGLRWAVLKGRQNYLCPAAIEALLGELDLYATGEDRAALAWLALHARRSADGQVERIPASVRRRRRGLSWWLPRATAGEGPCGLARCRAPGCRLARALEAAGTADVVISNHALTLTWHEGLPDWHAVVFDEAHALEDAATSAFAREVSVEGLREATERLSGRGRRGGLAGTAAHAGAGRSGSSDLAASGGALRAAGEGLREAAGQLAQAVRAFVRPDDAGPEDEAAEDGGRAVEAGIGPADRGTPAWERLAERLAPVGARIAEAAGAADAALEASGRAVPPLPGLVAALTRSSRDLAAARDLLDEILERPDPSSCLVASLQGSAGALRALPVSVAGAIHGAVLARVPTVLTSATLTLRDDPDSVARRIGFDRLPPERRLPVLMVGSPFRLAEVSRAFVTADAPDPNGAPEEFLGHTVVVAARLAEPLGGRTLLLLAARGRIRPAAERLREKLARAGVEVLSQLEGSREHLADRMRADRRTVLVGARSFWEGVDIPGAALSAVVIERIPFESPDVPLFRARCDAETAAGRNGFTGFALPRALLLLRQGAGRLIRRTDDRGVVFLLGSSFLRRSYAGAALRAFPAGGAKVADTGTCLAEAERFLREQGLARERE